MPRMEASQIRGVRTPCDSPGVPTPIRRGSGGPQKPSSSLSEGLRGMFTIITETSEKTCVPNLHILGATPMSSWVAGAGKYSSRVSVRNVCRNGWETVVL
jgi:hypothetical protein